MCERASVGPGTHESIRTRYLRECVEPHALPPDLHIDICPQCNPRRNHVPSAISEHDRVLREAVRCPLVYGRQLDAGGGICSVASLRELSPGLDYTGSTQTASYKFRTFDRIRGIEEVAQVVRTLSSSEVTARRRAIIQGSAVRHAEHFRALPPPPPCREIRRGPQPGVPIAPTTPCNIGTQSVDYSNPRA